ncbi:MAG: hypothetical protein ACK5YU_13700 [Burkholderiales bacterium]|nr:hypothetical protein [Betaproteobacteria bacterium]
MREKWLTGLNQVKNVKTPGVAEWLKTGTYSWDFDAATSEYLLRIPRGDQSLSTAFAAEISRFSCAAFQSMLDAEVSARSLKSLAWPLVKDYYGAFYSGHAILRLTGRSITYIPTDLIHTLNKTASMYFGVNPQMKPGQYHLIFEKSAEVIRIKNTGSNGGSHEDMWRTLVAEAVSLENSILAKFGGGGVAGAAIVLLSKLRGELCFAGKHNGAWLSSVRNAINYRHDYGVWFPQAMKPNDASAIRSKISGWSQSACGVDALGTSKQHDLVRHVVVCNAMGGVLRALLQDLVNRAPVPTKCFVAAKPFRLLSDAKLP